MITDKHLTFAEAQTVTATALGADQTDLGPRTDNALIDIGTGERAFFIVTVDETVTASGSATVTFSLESADVATLDSGQVVHLTSAAIGKAALTLGTVAFVAAIPPADYKRYLGARFTVATGPLTAGKFSARIVKDIDAVKAYATRAKITI
jgi:hypothetical protein